MNKKEIQAIFFIFNTNPRFPPFLLYVRCKSGVTLVRRSFRDALCWVLGKQDIVDPVPKVHALPAQRECLQIACSNLVIGQYMFQVTSLPIQCILKVIEVF